MYEKDQLGNGAAKSAGRARHGKFGGFTKENGRLGVVQTGSSADIQMGMGMF